MPMTTTADHVPDLVRPRLRSGQRLSHLQALRGLAASLVALSHSVEALAQRGLASENFAARLGNSGYFGVAAFFIISGFIIYKTSRTSFGNARGATAFVVKRLIRIFPIYWVATALFVVLSPHRAEYTASDIVFSFLLVPHLIASVGTMHPLVGQGWTLQYEMLFYALFTVGLFFSRTRGPWAIMAMLVALVAYGASVMPLADLTDPVTLVAYWSRPIILLFAVGIGIGLLEKRLRGRLAIPYPFPIMLAIFAVWFAYSLMSEEPAVEQLRFPLVLVVWLLCATCVFASVFGRSGEGVLEQAAEAFGDASYSVYLFHTFILSALLRLHVQDRSPTLFVAAALVGANVFGLLMYRFVEKPILRTLRRGLLGER